MWTDLREQHGLSSGHLLSRSHEGGLSAARTVETDREAKRSDENKRIVASTEESICTNEGSYINPRNERNETSDGVEWNRGETRVKPSVEFTPVMTQKRQKQPNNQ